MMRYKSSTILDFDAFFAAHPEESKYLGSGWNTLRDSILISLNYNEDVLTEKNELTISLLGHYWDVVFELVLSDIVNVAGPKQLFQIPEIRDVQCQESGSERSLILSTYYENMEDWHIDFAEGSIKKHVLLNPIKRK